MRQRLKDRPEFNINQAFYTMQASQREAQIYDPADAPDFVRFVFHRDLETLMKRHKHFDSL